MSTVLPEKFPDTGINQLAEAGIGYSPDEWPEAIDFVRGTLRMGREMAMADVDTIDFSKRQQRAIEEYAIPAIRGTLMSVLGTDERVDLPGTVHVSLLAQEEFEKYRGAGGRVAGTYYSTRNQIVINQGEHKTDAPEDLAYLTKVYLHERFHHISEQYSSLEAGRHLQIRRIGFHALGEDIREANKGQLTWDYFLAINEAITEKLAIEAYDKIAHFPFFAKANGQPASPFKAYPEYRELLETVMSDAVHYRVTDGTRAELWQQVASSYLTGDIKPLIDLVHATYPGLSMREFGLITKASELPRQSDFVPVPGGGPDGGDSWTLSDEYLTWLRNHINGKPTSDYVTDLPPPPMPPNPPASPAGIAFRQEIRQHKEAMMQVAQFAPNQEGQIVDSLGLPVSVDMNGNVVHRNEHWQRETFNLLASVSVQFRNRELTYEQAAGIMDHWLFVEARISELSAGFEEFYVTKHLLLDPATSQADFEHLLAEIQRKVIQPSNR